MSSSPLSIEEQIVTEKHGDIVKKINKAINNTFLEHYIFTAENPNLEIKWKEGICKITFDISGKSGYKTFVEFIKNTYHIDIYIFYTKSFNEHIQTNIIHSFVKNLRKIFENKIHIYMYNYSKL